MKNSDTLKQIKSTLLLILPPTLAGVLVYLGVFLVTVIDEKLQPYKLIVPALKTSDFQGTFFYRPLIDVIHGVSYFTGLQIVGTLTIYIFWAIIGIIVYFVANRLVADERQMAGAYSLRNYIWPSNSDAAQPFRDLVERLVLRFVVAVFIIVYLIKMIPLIDNWWQREHQDLVLTSRALRVNLLLLLFEVLFMHGLVVLLRLFLGRKRLLNG